MKTFAIAAIVLAAAVAASADPLIGQPITITDKFGGWAKASEVHFKDGGVFDQIYGSKS